jgi:hypothetical protein
MKALLNSIIGGIALAKRAKNAMEALEADLDSDGVPEKKELEAELAAARPVVFDLLDRAKRIYILAVTLAAHVLKEAKK